MADVVLPVKDVHVFARTPAEMTQAQEQMILWATSKVERQFAELREANEQLAIAKKSKWRVEPWQRHVRLAKAKIIFYQKVRTALKAGYYIVPPFPVDIFAIRTDRAYPKGRSTQSSKNWGPNFPQSARKLPEGEGRYVSDMPEVYIDQLPPTTDKEGRAIERYQHTAEYFREVDFPFRLVKPEVMTATAEAMALRVFDRLGVLPRFARKGDPIVVGQILPPDPNKEPLTFFVAWWMNTEDI